MYVIASILGMLAVASGAFGAHAIKQFVTAQELEVFRTGVSYHFYHVFALFLSAWFFNKSPSAEFRWAYRFFFFGIILFSGSLYAYVLTAKKFFVFITPAGGISFIVGWLLLAIGFHKKKNAA